MGKPAASKMKVERMKSFFSLAAILFAFLLLYNIILIQSVHTRKQNYLFIDKYLYMIKILQQYIHYKQLFLKNKKILNTST